MSTEKSTEKKVAVITGASRGIGAGLVTAFRRLDYRVVAVSRSIRPSDDPNILAIAGDIGEAETGRRAITEGMAKFGRIDSLINHAGIFIPSEFTRYTEHQYQAMLWTNLNGFFFITQQAIEVMESRKSGHIVNVTTSLVDHANSSVPSVLASLTKGGLQSATKSLAIEYAKRGIRVNAVSPGIIKTPMHAPETYEARARMHPMGRMGEIPDIVEAILYLESATFVTGEILHVDGGQSAGR
jgi:NAD(P)-dependent dehydrogenase (short-subunit alcohol dehydrogenase family)